MRMRRARRWLETLWLGCGLFWLWSVLAVLPCQGEVRLDLQLTQPAAAQHYLAAKAALASRSWQKAQLELEQVYLVTPHPELLRALAEVAHELGTRWLEVELYRRYYAESPAPAAIPEPIQARIAGAELESAQVVVRGDANLALCVDGRMVGTLRNNWFLWLEPRPHELVLGCQQRRQFVAVRAELELPVVVDFFEGTPTKERTLPVLASFDGQVTPPPELQPVVAGLREELLRQNRHLWSVARLARELTHQPPNCLRDRDCGLQLARRHEAHFWFVFSSPASPQEPWQVEVINVEAGVPCAHQALPCRNCTSAASAAQEVLGELLQKATALGTGKVRLESRPPAAQIYLDDETVARKQTPEIFTLLEGPHQVTLRKRGYFTRRAQLTVSRGQLELPEPFVLDVNQAARRRDRLAGLKWSLGTLGVLAVAGGIVALALDHQLSREITDDSSGASFQQTLVSWPHGVAALGGGVLLLGGAGLVYWQQRRADQAAQAAER